MEEGVHENTSAYYHTMQTLATVQAIERVERRDLLLPCWSIQQSLTPPPHVYRRASKHDDYMQDIHECGRREVLDCPPYEREVKTKEEGELLDACPDNVEVQIEHGHGPQSLDVCCDMGI